MFFRGRQLEPAIWRRFRSGVDGFVFTREAEHFEAHVVANAERVTDLFHALTEQLPPAVDVVVEDQRNGRTWEGRGIALPDIRETIARLKVMLAAHGGVEIAVYSAEDQLTLNGQVELFIYSRTDRWLYILQGKGLEEARRVRTRSWKLKRGEFPPAPDLTAALAAAVERLGLGAA